MILRGIGVAGGLVVGGLIFGLGIAGSGGAVAQSKPAPARPAPPSAGPARPLAVGPVTYFMTKCSSCHGPDGSALGAGFAAKLNDDQIRIKVREMSETYAEAPLKGEDLAAQAALVRALAKGEPYVAWTRMESAAVGGELMPGTQVQAVASGKPLPVQTRAIGWTVRLPGGVRPTDVVVTAARGPRRHQLRLGAGRHSFHGGPAAAPRRGR